MRKKLKKLCALVLSAVTVLSILPSSGLVIAETDTDITAEESVQSTVYFKVPNPSGQVIVTSNADTDEEVIQTITVDEEKTTLTDKDGNNSDVTLTEEGYCLELTEEVGETINLEFVASDGYEVGTYHIISDAGDENESVEEITLSDDNKYEYTFTEESQVLEVTFNATQTTQSTMEENVVEEQDVSSQEEETVTEVTEPETTTENQESNNSSNETSNSNGVAEEEVGTSYVGVSEEEAQAYNDGLIEEIEPTDSGTIEVENSTPTKARSSASARATYTQYGTNSLKNIAGVSRQSLLNWLSSHISDNFYLSTPYNPGWIPGIGMSADYRNPNGDCNGAYGSADRPGVAGMNCTGFVWHALTAAGGKGIPGISGWVNFIRDNGIQYRTYTGNSQSSVISSLLSDGWAEPGDIIWMWDTSSGNMQNGLCYGLSDYHHVGIYTGNYFDESYPYSGWYFKSAGNNGLWHSTDHNVPKAGNLITGIAPKVNCLAITVVRTDELPATGSGYDSDDTSQ